MKKQKFKERKRSYKYKAKSAKWCRIALVISVFYLKQGYSFCSLIQNSNWWCILFSVTGSGQYPVTPACSYRSDDSPDESHDVRFALMGRARLVTIQLSALHFMLFWALCRTWDVPVTAGPVGPREPSLHIGDQPAVILKVHVCICNSFGKAFFSCAAYENQ